MKIFSSLFLLFLILEINSQQNNTNNSNVQQNNIQKPKEEVPKINTHQPSNPNNNQTINNNQKNTTNNIQNNDNKQNKSNNTRVNETKEIPKSNNNQQQQNNQKQQHQQNQEHHKQQNSNKNIADPQKNATDSKKPEIPKKDNNNRGVKPNQTKEEKKEEKKEDKPFNLTESLINFFKETFGNNTDKNKKNETKEEETEEMKKRRQAEEQQKLMLEREKRRREQFEARAKAELIKLENKKKEEMRKREIEERAKFENILSNTTFDEIIQISLQKGETETLYLDLESFTKLKMAVVLTDEDQKINFDLSGPNSHGRTSVLYKAYNKNYFYYEYETLRKGEYIIEIKNQGNKENELVFLVKEHNEKKKDNINVEKIDKITNMLNSIDSNINLLRNKKKIEIRQINSHNEKVDKNNRSIVIYSIIEIFTMIFIFIAQSYYISSMVSKV
jgi:hypothetical protein